MSLWFRKEERERRDESRADLGFDLVFRRKQLDIDLEYEIIKCLKILLNSKVRP